MFVSVVIPMYNAKATIENCLKALMVQTYKKYEVVLVDDGSKDDSVNLAEAIAKKHKNLRVFARPHAGPAKQRNFGASKARGDVVLFIDSDCIAPKDAVEKIVKGFKMHPEVAGVSGVYGTLNKEQMVARYVGYEIAERHSREGMYTNFYGTYCCAYKKEIFDKFKGFDEDFPIASGEDPELSFRIADAGYKLLLDKTIFVYHPHPGTLKGFLKQQYGRAFWRALMYKKHPDKVKGDSYTNNISIAIMCIAMAAFIASLALSLFSFQWLYAALAALLIFLAANAGTIIYAARQEAIMIIAAPVIVFLRTLVWVYALIMGLIHVFIK